MKNFFRFLYYLVIVVLLLVPTYSLAVEESGTFETVEWNLSNDGTLVIKGSGPVESGPWLAYAKQIKSVIIEDGITDISANVFKDCKNIVSVTFGKDVNMQDGFWNCKKINTIILNGTEHFYPKAFGSTITKVEINGDCPYYIENDMVISTDGKKVILYFGSATAIIPEGVTTIGNDAFADNKTVREVVFPSTLTCIESSAFARCVNIQAYEFPESLSKIDDNAFWCNYKLEKVVFHSNYISFKSSSAAFGACEKLKTISIPKCDEIPDRFFSEDKNLKTVVINEGPTEIQWKAFDGCSGLTELYLPDSVQIFDNEAISHSAPNLVICCHEGTEAEKYAKNNGFNYKLIKSVTGIELSESTVEITKGKSTTISVAVNPSDATNQEVDWRSTDRTIADVANGKIQAINAGKCDIVCSTKDGSGVQAVCHVEVKVDVKSIKINEKKPTLLVGASDELSTMSLTYTVLPEEASWKDVTWESSDETIASVDEKGIIKGFSPGKVVISAFATQPESTVKTQITVTVSQAVTGLKLDNEKIEIAVKKKAKLKAEAFPENAANKKVMWTSSDETIAKVNANGEIQGLSAGQATITATTTDQGNVSASCLVDVRIPVQGVSTNEKNIVLLIGADPSSAQAKLTYNLKPEDAHYQSGTWISSDDNIASIDSEGTVRGLKAGKAVVTFTSDDPFSVQKTQVNVQVIQAVTAIVLDQTVYDVPIGKTKKITASIEPADANDKKIDWSSSDETIVKIDANGTIRAVSPGSAEIVASANDGSGVKAKCNVTVYVPLANRQNGDYIYFVDENEKVTIVKYTGTESGELIVPDMINGYPVSYIGEKAFEQCSAKCVILPNTLEEIGTEAFYYAETTKIELPSNPVIIGYEAFMCTKIETMHIPSNATFREGNPFRGCRNLKQIMVDSDNKQYEIFEGALVNKSSMELIVIPYGLIGDDLVIPDGIKIIGDTAFGYESPKFSHLVIPDSVEEIKRSAFAFSPVQHITIGSGVKKMGYGSFAYCKSLSTVTIKEGTTFIGEGAFNNCENLKEIIIPNSVSKIAQNAFDNITMVKIITNPDSAAAKYATKYGFNWSTPTE